MDYLAATSSNTKKKKKIHILYFIFVSCYVNKNKDFPPEHTIAALLYRMESDAAMCRLTVLFQFKINAGQGSKLIKAKDIKQLAEYRLIPLGIQLMQLLYVRECDQKRPQNDLRYLLPVVISFLEFLLNKERFNDKEFQSKVNALFPYVAKLVQCQNQEIRSLVSSLLQKRIKQSLK
ncbi:hypothetical protein RFI_13234 [Reticulomyxa filosa]|uniref:Sec7/BIG1-like C-terminal domain-containing protein n=1 Tax=Reticulomyxa filosa TaxID=46433 RepID=X6NDW9_RETFI|nr:hypothetical protein RFI_13234 [Reticulomyxa filosa]|eukprot:ETO23924.1 hypothetical protein RFI_13234 [Reticulomyxa filosa]